MAELAGRHVLLPRSRLPIVAEQEGVSVKEIGDQQLQQRLRRQGAILE